MNTCKKRGCKTTFSANVKYCPDHQAPKPVTAWAGYRDGTLLWFCTDKKYAEKRAELFRHQLTKVRVTPQ